MFTLSTRTTHRLVKWGTAAGLLALLSMVAPPAGSLEGVPAGQSQGQLLRENVGDTSPVIPLLTVAQANRVGIPEDIPLSVSASRGHASADATWTVRLPDPGRLRGVLPFEGYLHPTDYPVSGSLAMGSGHDETVGQGHWTTGGLEPAAVHAHSPDSGYHEMGPHHGPHGGDHRPGPCPSEPVPEPATLALVALGAAAALGWHRRRWSGVQ